MNYLSKNPGSKIITQDLKYSNKNDRQNIRYILINEQNGFCAYSERYFNNTDQVDIEHFDPRLKSSEEDNYYNWYAVLAFMNSHKPKIIEPFIPFLSPSSHDFKNRISYSDGLFFSSNTDDTEATNLIDYLGFNKKELYDDRSKHINRLKSILFFLGNDKERLKDHLTNTKEDQSFITAIKHEFQINI
jgi:hypothetical protein